jgi:hypothetical protein
MPANNVRQIKIWNAAHQYLEVVREEYRKMGISSESMTALASKAIMQIQLPNPNGNGHKPDCPPCPDTRPEPTPQDRIQADPADEAAAKSAETGQPGPSR